MNIVYGQVDDAYEVYIDLPGVRESDISIEADHVDGQTHLVVKGKRDLPSKTTLMPIRDYCFDPPRYGDLTQGIYLKRLVNLSAITAFLSNGVLKLVLPFESKKQIVRLALT